MYGLNTLLVALDLSLVFIGTTKIFILFFIVNEKGCQCFKYISNVFCGVRL